MTTTSGTGKVARREAGLAPTLVLGGTGKTGRRVAERLLAQGVQVRIGSRRAALPFDWDRPETWEAALNGAGDV